MRLRRIFFIREKYDEVIRRGKLIFENNNFFPVTSTSQFRARNFHRFYELLPSPWFIFINCQYLQGFRRYVVSFSCIVNRYKMSCPPEPEHGITEWNAEILSAAGVKV